MDGWICLHRQILESDVFAHPVSLKIWIWCLCKATHGKKSITLRSGESMMTVKISKGQFVFGRFKAEEELGIDGSTVYKWMKKFSEEWNMIKIDSNNRYSIVTILNFSKFQDNLVKEKRKRSSRVTAEEQQSNNSVAAEEQQRNTYNNVNNVNNISERANAFHQQLLPYVTEFGKQTIQDFFTYWTEPSKDGRTLRFEGEKYFDTGRRLGTWRKRDKSNHDSHSKNPYKIQ